MAKVDKERSNGGPAHPFSLDDEGEEDKRE